METLLSGPELAASLLDQVRREHESQAQVTEMDRLRNKVRGIEEQIETLAEHLAKIPKGLSPAPIFAQIQGLESMKSDS